MFRPLFFREPAWPFEETASNLVTPSDLLRLSMPHPNMQDGDNKISNLASTAENPQTPQLYPSIL